MKVIKPMCLSLLSRPFEFGQRRLLGISTLCMMPMDGRHELRSESELWQTASDVLGTEAALDAGVPKRRGEVLVAGNAWTREGEDRTKCRTRLALGDIRKELNVFGDRVFHGERAGQPAMFESMGLTWSNAFGGEGFPSNPLGKGYGKVVDARGDKVHPLPNIEYPKDMLYRPGQKTRPAGFGPLDMAWPQRVSKGGTYDAKWLETEFPGFPSDIDWAYFNAASDDQQTAEPFLGNESWFLENMHPDKPRLSGTLPNIGARCFFKRHGFDELEEMKSDLTTVWLFPERERIILVFHSAIEVEQPDGRDISVLMVGADTASSWRSMEHYADVLAKRLDDEHGMFHMLSEDQLGPLGFKKNVGLDAESIMREIPDSVRAVNMEAAMQDQLKQGAATISEGMASLEMDPPTIEKPPDFDFDAGKLKRLRLDELPELLDRLNAQTVECTEALERQAKERQTQLEESLEALKSEYPDQVIPDGKPHAGPPGFDASQHEARIREQLAQMQRNDIDVADLETQLLDADMMEFISTAEGELSRAYQLSAHMQPAIGDGYERGGSRQDLLDALDRDQPLSRADFCGVDLSGSDLSGRDLTGIYLESANLSKANLMGTKLDGAVLARADLSGARLDQACLQGANLGSANLMDCSACGAEFGQAIMTAANLTRANLDGARLVDTDMREVRFHQTCMRGISSVDLLIMEASIASTDFTSADLTGAVFFKVDIAQCDFSEANLSGAAFVGCRGVQASFTNATMRNVRLVAESDFSGARFSGANLTESNLRGTVLSQSLFDHANLDNADLSESLANDARFYRATAKCCQLINADLRGADLSGVNLMEGSLERADLRGANLKGCNLFALDLSRAHVDQRTDFDDALTKRMRIHPLKFPKRAP
jgi:uncharacterized protein YjbI with pentapeptide repeats